jgi:hypothetical protein
MSWEKILKERPDKIGTGRNKRARKKRGGQSEDPDSPVAIEREKTYQGRYQLRETEAAKKVVDENGMNRMGLTDIYFLSNFLPEEGDSDKYSDDENWEQGSKMIELSKRLEKIHDELEEGLHEAREFLKDIGL